jgi:hypothetical protein
MRSRRISDARLSVHRFAGNEMLESQPLEFVVIGNGLLGEAHSRAVRLAVMHDDAKPANLDHPRPAALNAIPRDAEIVLS